jgi:tRNA (guanine-N7-)-methyltransferase
MLRSGRVTRQQQEIYERERGNLLVPFQKEPLDLSRLFGGVNGIVLEIGFGTGEASAEIAKARPDVGFLGVEVYRAGVAKLLQRIVREQIPNIRIVEHDVVEVLTWMIPPQGLSGCHVFFPDPWPKKRHHKRRLLDEAFLRLLADRLEGRGYLYVASDWEPYAQEILATVARMPEYENPHPGFAPRSAWRPVTRFEEKGVQEQRRIYEILARRGMSSALD